MLNIKNLKVAVHGTQILNGLSLSVPAGEVHAIMGPNGAGKSTLSYALTGRPNYDILGGTATLNGVDILTLEPEERAALGLFLSFQYPLEIPGVPTLTFLRTALNEQRKTRGEDEIPVPQFMRMAREAAKRLGVSDDMLKRPLNVGFSGGEKKRMEILQMLTLKPKFAVMDETDSGLDIDALRIVSKGVNRLAGPAFGLLVITHYERILTHIKPDHMHVLIDGKIALSGGPDLVQKVEKQGYDWIREQFGQEVLV